MVSIRVKQTLLEIFGGKKNKQAVESNVSNIVEKKCGIIDDFVITEF